MSATNDGAKGFGSALLAKRMPWLVPILARVRDDIVPRLWAFRAFLFVLVPLGLVGLGLHVFSQAVTDDQVIRARLTEGVLSNQAFKIDPIDEALHFPECMAISMMVHEAGRPGLHGILANDSLAWHDNISLCGALRDAVKDEGSVAWGTYARYWHGNLVAQRLWLGSFDYVSLKTACWTITLIAALVFALALVRRGLPLVAVVTVGMGLALSDVLVVSDYPTQGASLATFFLMAALFVSLPLHARAGRAGWSLLGIAVAAYVCGAVYNYFDFLYNPGLFAGLLGWSLIVTGLGREPLRKLIRWAGVVCVAAVAGYVAMWFAKWTVTDLYQMFSGDSFGIVSVGNFEHWAMGGETSVWPLKATGILIGAAFHEPWKIPVAVVMTIATGLFAWRRGGLKALGAACLPLGFTILTLEIASGHSVNHGFTVRAIPWIIAAFCGAAIVAGMKARAQQLSASPGPAPPV